MQIVRDMDWQRWRAPLVAGVIALLVFAVLYLGPLMPSGTSPTVTLTGQARPAAAALFKINERPYGKFELKPVESTQSIRIGSQPIETYQIELVGKPGTRITIGALKIAYGTRVAQDRQGAQLGVLQTGELANAKFDERGLTTTLTMAGRNIQDTPLPPLDAPGAIGSAQSWLIGSSRAPLIANVWVVGLLLGLIMVVAYVRGRVLLAVALGIGVWLLSVALYKLGPEIVNPGPPVDVAVGGASFFGTPYYGGQIAAWTCLALILGGAVGWQLMQLRRRSSAGATPSARAEEGLTESNLPGSTWLRRDVVAIAVAWLLVSLTLAPTLSIASLEPVGSGWDTGNLLSWNFFRQIGLVAMRDYWTPYGNQGMFAEMPQGPVWFWLFNSVMLAIFAWCMWRISEARRGRVIVCLIAVAIASSLGDGLWRYFPGFLVGLSYAAIGPVNHRRFTSGHLVLGFASLLALFIEPDLLLYGLAGAGLVVFGDILLCRLPVRPAKELARGLLINAVPIVAALGLILVFWAAKGSLGGNLEYYLHLTDVSAYGALEQTMEGALAKVSFLPNTNTMVDVLPFLLLFVALVQGFAVSKPTSMGASRLLLAASGVSFVMLQRSLVRPHDLVVNIPVVALICAAVLLWDRRATIAVALTGAFAGAMIAGLQQHEKLQNYLSGAGSAPFRAIESALYLSHQGEVQLARQTVFDPRRFKSWPESKIARELMRVTKSTKPPFAVLGDGAMLYVLMVQRPPLHVNMYDVAPVFQQQNEIEKLAERRPKYLVWKRDAFAVDGVPYLVRSPLLYLYAIENYVPLKLGLKECPPARPTCVAADILTLRKPDQPIAADYWRSRLAGTLGLGFIPSYAEAPKGECTDVTECANYAVVTGQPKRNDQPIELDVKNGNHDYRVAFFSRSGVDTYTIRLDHLWFWPLLSSDLKLATPTPGWAVTRRQGPPVGRLY